MDFSWSINCICFSQPIYAITAIVLKGSAKVALEALVTKKFKQAI